MRASAYRHCPRGADLSNNRVADAYGQWPILRLPSAFPIDNCERKPPQDKFRVECSPLGSVRVTPSPRRWLDRSRYQPRADLNSASAAGWLNGLSGHLRMAAIWRRASAHEIGFTLPESNSWMRRTISLFHSSSAASSTVSSSLSRRRLASAARASAGKASACFSNSEIP